LVFSSVVVNFTGITPNAVNIQLGKNKSVRRAYGIDEIALVPGKRTIDYDETDPSWMIGGINREIPIIASGMDSVVDVNVSAELTKLGSIGVLNMEGIQTRYDDPKPFFTKIAEVGNKEFVPLMQEIYKQPIRENLITKRVQEIKEKGGIAALSGTPQAAIKFKNVIKNSGMDIFFLQATVVSTEHIGIEGQESLDIKELCQTLGIPVVVGNCVTYEVAKQLIKSGIAGLMVGIGPGAACTSRGVLGIGLPQATAISDCSYARDEYFKETGKYIPIIADGGIITGGDICKCLACGADSVMIGSPIARSSEAPGNGFHWGMATPSPLLPRGTRINVGTTGSLERILRGPALLDDGTHNLLGAIKTSMGTLGVQNIKEMQNVEVVIAPSLLTEGKIYQKAQHLGMGK
tara:strand:+ start:67 stop:1281 length:1215 start_codon:yes stop_codon:yes gene_type:complete